jgi:hypothetical protein
MKSLLKKSVPLALMLVLGLLSSLAFANPTTTPPAGGGGGQTSVPPTPQTTVGAGGDPFTNVTQATCNIAGWLRGPVGVAVGFLVLVAGLIALQIANRDAIPMVSRAVIGTALLLGAAAAFSAIVTAQGCGQ